MSTILGQTQISLLSLIGKLGLVPDIGIITLLKRGNGYLPMRFYPDEGFPTWGSLRAYSLPNLLTLDANPNADSKFQWD